MNLQNSSSKMRKSSSISVDGIESPLLKTDSLEEKLYNAEKPSQYTIWQQSIAECIGTAILLAFGTGSVAQYLLTGLTDMTALHMTWGYGVAFGVIASYRISGAHLNPAVTIGFWSIGGFPANKILPYIFAQVFGGFLGSAFTFFSYYDLLIDNRNLKTSGIFCTYRADGIGWFGAFVIEFLGTMILQACIMIIVDKKHGVKANVWLVAGYVGVVVIAIGNAFGANTGYAINPARDFGPRLFTLASGFGTEPWTAKNSYWVIPITAPILGAIAGAHLMQRTILSYG